MRVALTAAPTLTRHIRSNIAALAFWNGAVSAAPAALIGKQDRAQRLGRAAKGIDRGGFVGDIRRDGEGGMACGDGIKQGGLAPSENGSGHRI